MRLYALALFITASLLITACGNAADSNRTADANARNSNAAAAPSVSPAAPARTPDEFAAVRATYARECQRCHKPEGTGGVFEEEGLKPLKVPSLREGHAVTHDDQRLARMIANGDDGMPSFKDKLRPEEINQLVRFIRKEFQGQTPAPAAANTNASANTR